MKYMKILVLIFIVLVVSCVGDRTAEEMNIAISKSSVLERLDKLCTEMPKPNDFRFVEKQFGGNTNLASLVFDYYSDLKPVEIKQFYSVWAKKNQWKPLEENKYTKDNQTIVVEFGYLNPTHVTISCKEPR